MSSQKSNFGLLPLGCGKSLVHSNQTQVPRIDLFQDPSVWQRNRSRYRIRLWQIRTELAQTDIAARAPRDIGCGKIVGHRLYAGSEKNIPGQIQYRSVCVGSDDRESVDYEIDHKMTSLRKPAD